uniref:LAGLIDADG endonuclease n=1 Tax=Fusarium asiaticum TaxID=282267 RepID=A0A6M5C5T5_FUSAS|nr:LAGLIDADG endonuclease [Fusarium asiaticum]QJT69241.1 LAGLIDADG endonuclease [Fusarium asiaticum]QJT69300.1 LAGLIDADG endonuclease [Fusarium asiaticum]
MFLGITMVPVLLKKILVSSCLLGLIYINQSVYTYKSLRKFSSNSQDRQLYYYLAGLIEGDGHLYVPKHLKTESGKTTTASIEVVFALKDLSSAEYLKGIIGGNVYKRLDKNAVRWMIQDKATVTFIVNAINGKLRTPKIHYLHSLIDFLNSKGDNIVKLPLDNSPIENNAWFAGFIDSDGNFSIKGFSSDNLRTYLGFQFYLPQRAIGVNGDSSEVIMQKLADFLNCKLSFKTFKEGFTQYVVNTSSKESNKILVEYLERYPLLSSKYLDFKDWEKALNLYLKKLHRDPKYLEEIRNLKLGMNRGRDKFNVDHINNSIYRI